MDKKEIRDLFVSTVVIGVLFSLSDLTVLNLISSLIIVGIAFVFHELAHRETARKFGAAAEYRMWPAGLLTAIVLGIVSGGRIIFAAPGAVYISALKMSRWKAEYSSLTNEEYGFISAVGPLANMGLSILFLILNAVYPSNLFAMGAAINIFLAFFNLLPFPPFDGSKVMRWDRKTWLVMFLASTVGFAGALAL